MTQGSSQNPEKCYNFKQRKVYQVHVLVNLIIGSTMDDDGAKYLLHIYGIIVVGNIKKPSESIILHFIARYHDHFRRA